MRLLRSSRSVRHMMTLRDTFIMMFVRVLDPTHHGTLATDLSSLLSDIKGSMCSRPLPEFIPWRQASVAQGKTFDCRVPATDRILLRHPVPKGAGVAV